MVLRWPKKGRKLTESSEMAQERLLSCIGIIKAAVLGYDEERMNISDTLHSPAS